MSEDQMNEQTEAPPVSQNQTSDVSSNALSGLNNLDVVLNIPVDVSLELGRAANPVHVLDLLLRSVPLCRPSAGS